MDDLTNDPMQALQKAQSIGADVPSQKQISIGMMPATPRSLGLITGRQFGPYLSNDLQRVQDKLGGLAKTALARYGYDQYVQRFGKPQFASKLEEILTQLHLNPNGNQ